MQLWLIHQCNLDCLGILGLKNRPRKGSPSSLRCYIDYWPAFGRLSVLIDLAHDSESFGDYLVLIRKVFALELFWSIDRSGPDSIQRLKVTGFSVRPRQPPKPFTLRFSCSCAWSNGIPEFVLATVITQFPWISNSSLIGWGKDFISLMWTGSHLTYWHGLICAYVAKRYFNLKATVDVQITALFLNSSPTVTYLTTVKLQSKWKICVLNMKLHFKGWNIRSEMLLTILLGNPHIFTRLFTWSLSGCIRINVRRVFKCVMLFYTKGLIRRQVLCDCILA